MVELVLVMDAYATRWDIVLLSMVVKWWDCGMGSLVWSSSKWIYNCKAHTAVLETGNHRIFHMNTEENTSWQTTKFLLTNVTLKKSWEKKYTNRIVANTWDICIVTSFVLSMKKLRCGFYVLVHRLKQTWYIG